MIRDPLQTLRQAAPAVLPSMLLCDFRNLQSEVARLLEAGVQGLHLDVMDGHFVPNFTYGMPLVAAFRQLTSLPLDVHLMMDNPGQYLQAFAEAGASTLTIHVEAVDRPRELLGEIRRLGLGAGIAFNPATPVETVEPLLGHCDLMLVMSVPAGFGGQPFDPVAIEKLRHLRKARPEGLLLEVDGGINTETIGPCAAAGADLFVVGSAIFRSPDYRSAIVDLQRRIADSPVPK